MSEPLDFTKQAATRPLHFVNTDAGTIINKDTGKRIRDAKSHLSGHYRRWKKQQVLPAQAAQHRQQVAEKEKKGDNFASSSHQDDLKERVQTLTVVDSTYPSDSPPYELGYDGRNVLQQRSWTLEESVALLGVLNHGNSDPFNVLPLPADPSTNMYIQLFYRGITLPCWAHYAEPRLKILVQNEALMHGVLAISKIIAATYLPTPQSCPDLLPASQQHYGELLRLMRAHILDPSQVDSSFAMEMMHSAMMFSFLAREFEEFEVHLTSLKSLVDSLGGLRAIHWIHSARFLNAERLRGLFLFKKPLISVEGWTPRPWYEEDQFRRYDEPYEQGRSMMSSMKTPVVPDGLFSGRLRDLILDHRDMLAACNVIVTLFPAQQTDRNKIISWIAFRSHTLTIRTIELVSEITQVKKSQPSVEISLQASACLATNFIAHLMHVSRKPIVGLSHVPCTILIQMLHEVAAGVQQGLALQHQDLYLWALFVGACTELASRTWSCDRSFRGSSWCSENLAYMIEKLGIDTCDDLEQKLRRFLLPPMLEPYMKILFDKRHCLITLSLENLQLQLRD